MIKIVYDKEKHTAFLHKLVCDIQKECPDENVWVDESIPCIVWGAKK